MGRDQTMIAWRGTVPVSTRFDDPYYSLEDGLAETQYVFLKGNGLPARFRDGFHIAELGFGTGLNFLAALDAFRRSVPSGILCFTSFEKYPMVLDDMDAALASFPTLRKEILLSRDGHDTPTTIIGPDFRLQVILGDAQATLPRWKGAADAWFLDGFAPAKNPSLWTPELMRAVAKHTAPEGTFATYTAVGAVRRALMDAGFEVSRIPGFGCKRHMSVGILK